MSYRSIILHHFNIRVLCFLWRLTYSGEFLAVVQSLKSLICHHEYNQTVCSNLGNEEKYAEYQHHVYSLLTMWQTIIMLSWMIPSFFLIPLIAVYLNKGRKTTAIKIMAFLQLLSSIMYLLNSIYPDMYVIGYIVAAVLHASYGFTYGFRLITYAYLADIVASYTPERRSAEMILQSSFRALGAVLSPYIMGYLLQHFGAKYAFIMSSACDGLMLLYCFMLVEVRPTNSPGVDDERTPLTDNKSSKENGALQRFFAPLTQHKGPIIRIIIVYSILESLTIITFNFLPIYLTHSPINFTSVDLGLYQTIQYGMAFCGSMLVSQIFTRLVGKQDVYIVLTCIFARFFMYAVFMVAESHMLLYVALLAEGINYTYVGALYSYATEFTGRNSFVPLFTAMSIIGLLCCAISYPVTNVLFKETAKENPKLVFIFLLSLTAVAFITWIIHIVLRQRTIKGEQRGLTADIDDDETNSTGYGSIGSLNYDRHMIIRPATTTW